MIFSIGGSGGSKDTKEESKGKQQEDELTGQLESSTKTGVTGEKSFEELFGEESTRLLDEETLNILRSLIGGAAGGFAGGGAEAAALGDFAGFLRERAAGTQEFFDERTGQIVGAAEARGESRVQRRGTNLAQSAGSTFNTLVQQGINRDEIQLDTELAALESNLALQGRAAETAALSEAANVSSIASRVQTQPLMDLVSMLRGAETFQQQIGGVRRERTEFTLEDILNALSGQRTGLTEFETKGKSQTDQASGGFEFGI